MIPRGPVLFVKHAALDNVDPNDTDGLREVWSSFSGAKQSISQGTRLEYLSWRLYSRSILQRKRQANTLEVPELDVPPALEMSSSTDSLVPAGGRLSSQKLMTLFDRIVTIPATPEDLDKPVLETEPLASASIDHPVVKVTPVSTPEMEVPPIAIPRAAEPSPAVCGFDKVSVSSRSTVSVSSMLSASPTRKSSLKIPAPAAAPPQGSFGSSQSKSMFFIESSSDSDAESENLSPLVDSIPVPTPTRPGLVRRKTVTFEEPAKSLDEDGGWEEGSWDDDDDGAADDQDEDLQAAPVSGSAAAAAPAHSESDDFEDCSDTDQDQEQPDKSEDPHDWGDSDWDDLSEDDEPLFSGRDVPLQPQEHRSLLSSMFVGCEPQHGEEQFTDSEDEQEHLVPSPGSLPRATPEAGSVPHLGRVESQSSMFDHAMRGQHGQHGQHEQILLRGPIRAHRPFRNTKSSEDLMERELSQSVRSNISNKRQYDLDALWAKQNATPVAAQTQTHTRERRPTLSRSSTLPARGSLGFDDGPEDDLGYHAKGW